MPVVSFDAYVTMLFNPTTTYIELLQGFNMFACIFVVAQRTAQNQLSTSSEDRSKPARFDGERETEIERERERETERQRGRDKSKLVVVMLVRLVVWRCWLW